MGSTVCARNRVLHKQRHCTDNFFLFFGFSSLLKLVKISQKFKAQSLVGRMWASVPTNAGARSPALADKMGPFKND